MFDGIKHINLRQTTDTLEHLDSKPGVKNVEK